MSLDDHITAESQVLVDLLSKAIRGELTKEVSLGDPGFVYNAEIDRAATLALCTPSNEMHDQILYIRRRLPDVKIYPLEQDSCGWLVGCIDVPGFGKVSFG